MIGLGSNRLTVCRRGGMSVTQAGRGGMEWLAGGRIPSWVTPYSAQAAAALKAQFPTQWPTIRDYGFAHPEIVPYVNAAPLMIGQMFAIEDLYAVVQAGLMSLKTLQDNSMWLLICHHHIKNGTQKFNNATDAEYRVDSELLSILKYTGLWLKDSKYEFLAEEYMLETDTTPAAYRWSQTSNPYTQTSVSGYVNISNGHGGIYRYNSNTLMSTGVGGWFGDPGCYTFWQGGIPSFQGNPKVCKGTLDVWIRVA